MGIFKDLGKMAEDGQNMAATAAQWSQSANQYADSLQAGIAEGSYDPNDPAFAPIEGVDLDSYAKAVAAVVKAGAKDEAGAAKAAEAAGIPKGKWAAINDGWTQRMKESRVVMNRYGTIYGQYSH